MRLVAINRREGFRAAKKVHSFHFFECGRCVAVEACHGLKDAGASSDSSGWAIVFATQHLTCLSNMVSKESPFIVWQGAEVKQSLPSAQRSGQLSDQKHPPYEQSYCCHNCLLRLLAAASAG